MKGQTLEVNGTTGPFRGSAWSSSWWRNVGRRCGRIGCIARLSSCSASFFPQRSVVFPLQPAKSPLFPFSPSKRFGCPISTSQKVRLLPLSPCETVGLSDQSTSHSSQVWVASHPRCRGERPHGPAEVRSRCSFFIFPFLFFGGCQPVKPLGIQKNS